MPARPFFPQLLAMAVVVSAAAVASADSLDAQLERGQALFAEACAVCHGASGEGASAFPNPIIGARNLAKFNHALGLYRYNRMMMPFDDPQSLDADEKWDVTAFLVHANGWLDGIDEPLGPENAEALVIPGS
jgi:cytochrome c